MTKRKRIALRVGLGLVACVVLIVAIVLITVQTSWFARFVREKAIASIDDATGGRTQIGAIDIDLMHLTVRIRDFVLHGTEPAGAHPFVRVGQLELRVKLFAASWLDLQYLGIQQPQVNVMVRPDGTTNIPQPKTSSPSSSSNSGLKTVVDLAVKRFELTNGLLEFLQQSTPLSGRGENLRALLQYDARKPSYTGKLALDPIVVRSGNQPPLDLHLNVPLVLERDAIRIGGASLTTRASRLDLSASLEHMDAPQVRAKLNARVSLPEMRTAFALPIETKAPDVPNQLTADAEVSLNEKTNALQIANARVVLGDTNLSASGSMTPGDRKGAHFSSSFALAQLCRLLGVGSVRPQGSLQANGQITLDRQNNYAIDGNLSTLNLGVTSGTTHLSELSLKSPFHVDPFLISMNGLRFDALGGSLAAKLFIENMQNASVEARLQNFSLPVIVSAATGKHLGYDAFFNGVLQGRGDLKAKGTTGYNAQAHLQIEPGRRGVPVNGALNVNFRGASGALDVGQSYISLPSTRLDLSGSLNRRIDLKLISRNLGDFLPAINFGAAKPQTTLPVVLQNDGSATLTAQLNGNTSDPNITAHLDVDDFAAQQHPFSRLALDLAASQRGASVKNGAVDGTGLTTRFDGSIGLRKWSPKPASPLSANLTLRNGQLGDLASLAGQSSLNATGATTADIHVGGTYGNPLGGITLQVLNGSVSEQPFSKLYTNVKLADQLVTLTNLEIDSAGGQLALTGDFRHPRESFSTGHAQFHLAGDNLQLSQVTAISKQNAGVAGVIHLLASGAADLRERGNKTVIEPATVNADLKASALQIQNQPAGDITATARTVNGNVNYNLHSDFAGSRIEAHGQTSLKPDYLTDAEANITDLSVEKALQLTGQSAIPAKGVFSASTRVDGVLSAPHAALDFGLRDANVYGEPIHSLKGNINYSNQLVDVRSIALDVPAGTLTLTGSFNHPADTFTSGALQLKVDSSDIQLDQIQHIQQAKPGLGGTFKLAANLAGNLRQEHGKSNLLLSDLTANMSASALHVNKVPLGGLNFNAKTAGQRLTFRLDSDVAQSRIHGQGEAQLTGDYPLKGNLTFANIRYSNLAPFLTNQQTAAPASYDGLVEGGASFSGPLLNPDDFTARLQLDRVNFRNVGTSTATGAPSARTIELQNQGPIVVSLNRDVVTIDQLRLAGRDTAIHAAGKVNLKDPDEPLALQLDADLDLGLLQAADRDFYSSGRITLDTSIRGSFAQPRANGEIQLKNASVNYAGVPNGLSNANGTIVLNGSNAAIQKLTGESGGGQVSLAGFVGLGAGTPAFNLQATATKVRVRYSGISATSNATVTLTGNLKRSLLAGNVSIERVAYASSSDAGSILSAASVPPETPSSPSPLLAGMRLAIHVVTAPDIQVISTYTNRLSVLANLTVRGTALAPGMLGRLSITDGQLVFFGNTYTVTTGNINFYDPTTISPVLNLSLQTIAQGVNVTIDVAGGINDLKLSYRSDPPLTFEQIVQLLATNTTPSNPVIAAHQPSPSQQSVTQMGESALLGQAVANPLASRVQRVFGLTQFKIDPSLANSAGQPSANVTLQQKIASNITFTYITDVRQTNAQIVRIEWDLTNNLSAVGLRDYNGNVSIEMFYKFTRR